MNAPTNHRHHCAALGQQCWLAGVPTAAAHGAAACVVAWVKRLMHLASAPRRMACPAWSASLPACLLGCLSGLSHVASLIEGPPMPETSFFVSWSASQPCVENAVPEPRVAVQCYCWQRYREYLQKIALFITY
jgi:hypothetical protein